MVRSNELGCRNGWNADLWVPANVEHAQPPVQPSSSIRGRAAAEVEPAEQSDLITSIVAAKTDNLSLPEQRIPSAALPVRPYVEEDIIVNQKPSLSWSAASTGPISSQPATELVQNPKAAILRARDQFRQRRKGEGRLADQRLAHSTAGYLASAREAQQVHEHDLTPPGPDPESVDPRFENRPLIRPQVSPYVEAQRPVSPVRMREIDRPFPSMTEFPEDRARFESVPYADAIGEGDQLIDVAQDDTWIETRQVDTILPEPYEVDEFFDEDDVVESASASDYEDEELSVHHRESILNRYLRQRRERRLLTEESYEIHQPSLSARAQPTTETYFEIEDVATETAPAAAESSVPFELDRSPDVTEGRFPSSQTIDAEHWAEPSPTRESFRSAPMPDPRQSRQPAIRHEEIQDDDFVIPPPLPEFEPRAARDTQLSETRPRPYERPSQAQRMPPPTQNETPLIDEFGDQPLFASHPDPAVDDVEIEAPYSRYEPPAYAANRIERICQSCRDFRPAENGERGWCNNKWAFNHRRMVDADDLACRNSLGSWWTPKDDSWRRDGDISRHAQQTPRVDQWLMGSQQNEQDRRRSSS